MVTSHLQYFKVFQVHHTFTEDCIPKFSCLVDAKASPHLHSISPFLVPTNDLQTLVVDGCIELEYTFTQDNLSGILQSHTLHIPYVQELAIPHSHLPYHHLVDCLIEDYYLKQLDQGALYFSAFVILFAHPPH